MQTKKIMEVKLTDGDSVNFMVTVNTSFTAAGMQKCSSSIDSAYYQSGLFKRSISIDGAIHKSGLDMEQIMERIDRL